jgi:hypothetical protein
MSSLYNMIMPPNPWLRSLFVLAFGSEDGDNVRVEVPQDLGRVRDAWINEKGTMVGILHRNYGEDDVFTPVVEETPNYVGYHPCDGDSTYAWWEFKVPFLGEGMVEAIAGLAEQAPNQHPMERYLELVNSLGDPAKADDPAVQHAMLAGEQIMGALNDSIETGEVREATNPTGGVVIYPVTNNEDNPDDL